MDAGDEEVQSVLDALRARVQVEDDPTTSSTPTNPASFANTTHQLESDLYDALRRAAHHATAPSGHPTGSRSHGVPYENYPPNPDSVADHFHLTPRPVRTPPHPHAVLAYKLVALRSDGVPVSVYDGSTEYHLGQTLYQRPRPGHGGGLYVFQSLDVCLQKARARTAFPRTAALINHESTSRSGGPGGSGGNGYGDIPRCVLEVYAWNEHAADVPLVYDKGKVAYAYLRAKAVMPLPPSFYMAEDVVAAGTGRKGEDRFAISGVHRAQFALTEAEKALGRLAPGRRSVGQLVRDATTEGVERAAAEKVGPGEGAHRAVRDRHEVALASRQAKTMVMEREIKEMEERLNAYKSAQSFARNVGL